MTTINMVKIALSIFSHKKAAMAKINRMINATTVPFKEVFLSDFASFFFFSTAIPPFRRCGLEKIYITWESPNLSYGVDLLRQTRDQMHHESQQNQCIIRSQFTVCVAVCIFQSLGIQCD